MVQTIFLYLCKHCLFNLTSYIKYIQNTMARLPFQAIVYHFYEFIISSFIFLIYIYKNTDVFYEDTKTHFLQVKKVVFVSQKGSFCTPKTILLQRKNHTFTRRICNIQITNTLRTFRECILNGLLIMQRPPTKYVANTPKTPTKHSVRRRGRFIAPVS